MRKVFVTGSAGFIGFHLCKLLLEEGFIVTGFDGMTDYYDVTLKERRQQVLLQNPNYTTHKAMLEDVAVCAIRTKLQNPTSLYISRHKQAYATALKTRAHVLNRISSALSI